MGRDQELIEAARSGNYPAVERILSIKPKKPGPFASLRRAQGGISSRDSQGYTAIHYASLNNHKEIVRLLLSYEASCNSVDGAGSSPLHLAAWAGNQEVVEILLTTGPSIPNVNLTNGDKETALHCAAQYGHTEVVQLLLGAGAEPNIKNSKEETALDLAAQYGRTETVSILLETHPEMVGKFTAYGSMVYLHTPLHLASRNGHKAVVELLIKVGIDINVRTSRGSALHEAGICGKVEVVKLLLDRGINTQLRDSSDRTILDIMEELQTQRTKEITRIILEHSSSSSTQPLSPYDNVSITNSLDSACSSTLGTELRPRATSWQTRERRRTASEEELDKRISSFSSTSGCSDCTTSTLQPARSYDSNFLSESELTMTGTLTRGDDTSISSASSTTSLSPVCQVRPGSSVSQNTLTSKPTADKPKLPAKPAHIRPGLKPVQIPNVDDKLGIKPKKPPRRNLSISPVRNPPWESEGGYDPSHGRKNMPQKSVYSSKSGSKSFDELDDILCDKSKKQGGRKRNRRTLSSVSSVDVSHDKEQKSNREYIPLESRHSCDEILDTDQVYRHGSDCSQLSDCQRCVLNSMSNRSLNIHCDEEQGKDRFISQRQYKRKIRREVPKGSVKYSTLDFRAEKRLNGSSPGTNAVLVSKTTYKLRSNHYDSELDSAGEEDTERSSGLELMEIPLSPTHYSQPSTPENDPPTPWEAESAIHNVLSFLKNEYQPSKRTVTTYTEPWMLLSLDPTQWPNSNPLVTDKSTCTQIDRKLPTGRKLPEIPRDEQIQLHIPTSPESDDSNPGEVILRHNPEEEDCIYQSIDKEESDESESNRVSQSSDKSQSLSILSPFDEQEEWSKISLIIDSFGANIGKQTEVGKETISTPNNSPIYDYPTLKKREKLTSTVGEWLNFINLNKYAANFESNGYDNINYIGGGLLSREDLIEIGITDQKDITVLIDSLKHRPHKFHFKENGEPECLELNLESWLSSLDLNQYLEKFRSNLIVDMDRVQGIWDDELSSIVEIEKVGHRRRILLSVAGPIGIKQRIGKVNIISETQKPEVKSNLKPVCNLSPHSTPKPATYSSEIGKSPLKKEKPKPEEKLQIVEKTRNTVADVILTPAKGKELEEKGKKKIEKEDVRSGDEKLKGDKQHHKDTKLGRMVKSPTSEDIPLCSIHSAQRRNTATSSTSEGSEKLDKPPTPVKRPGIESGTLTLGRRKKRAPLPPPSVPGDVSPQMKLRAQTSQNFKSIEVAQKKSSTSLDGCLRKTGTNQPSNETKGKSEVKEKDKDGRTFKVMYHGNTLVLQFDGVDSTKQAIEKVKKSRDIIKRTGMPTRLLVTDTELKTTIFEGQGVLHDHQINNICCVVQDSESPTMFGYITTDINNLQRFSHVFSAENKEKCSEILSRLSQEFQDGTNPEILDTKPKPRAKVVTPSGAGARSKSDHLVTRMKNFFQGGESSGVNRRDERRRRDEREGRRRRGGSMDNLIDVEDDINTTIRKKCSSIKNLSCVGPNNKNEVKITSV